MNRDQLLTSGDLEDFKNELFAMLAEYLKDGHDNKSLQWLRSADVRKLLKISPGTLQNLRITGKLPYKKVGGTIFYNQNDVNSMLG